MTAVPVAKTGFRGLLPPALTTLLALAVLVSLGVWQLERKGWKEGLLAQIEARAYGSAGEIVPEGGWPAWQPGSDEFRRVHLAGTFLADKAVAVHGLAELRSRQATLGFYLFVPLKLGDGSVVMVNRGFVPAELRDATLGRLRQEPPEADVRGLVRAPETRGWFVPENRPAAGEWFVRSLQDMNRWGGLDRVAPFYVDEEAGSDAARWPRGGQTQLTLPNNHLQYAWTWFGLAGSLAGVFAAFAWRRLSAQPDA